MDQERLELNLKRRLVMVVMKVMVAVTVEYVGVHRGKDLKMRKPWLPNKESRDRRIELRRLCDHSQVTFIIVSSNRHEKMQIGIQI